MTGRLRHRLRHYFRPEVIERELDDELRASLDIMASDAVCRGASPAEAKRRAFLELGGAEITKERVRPVLPGFWMHSIIRDIRYAVRRLARRPLFTATAVVSLALGIGAATAVYSWGSQMFFRDPPGVAAPKELVAVFLTDRDPEAYTIVSLPHFQELRAAQTVFSDMAGSFRFPVSFGLANGAREATVEFVTGTFFQTMGIRLVAGRAIDANDDVPGGPANVVLSDRMWREIYGAAPDVLGKSLRLNGQPFTIVGITAPEFEGVDYHVYGAPDLWASVQAYTPLVRTDRVTRRAPLLRTYGRLRPGVSGHAADAALNSIAPRLSYLANDTRHFTAVRTFRLNEIRVAGSGIREFFSVALFVTGLILAAGCFNISNLLISQGVSRRNELGMRLAIGATRGQLLRQLTVESLVLGIAGGAGGVAMAIVIASLFERFPPISSLGFALQTPAPIDLQALTFAAGITVIAVFAFGLLPAAMVSIRSPLTGGAVPAQWHSARRSRVRQSILSLQVASSVLLMVIAALFAASLLRIDAQVYPYAMDSLLLGRINPAALSAEGRTSFYTRLLDRLRSRGDVLGAALSANPLLTIGGAHVALTPAQEGEWSDFSTVGADYFKTLQVPVLAGREFTDHETTAVTILNRTLADRLWPGEDPIGRTVYFPGLPPVAAPYTVVGVVEQSRCQDQMTVRERPCVYRPVHLDGATTLTLHVRTSAAPGSFFMELTREVAGLSPDVVLDRTSTLRDYLAFVRTGPRAAVVMTVSAALMASLLSAIGCAALLLALVSESRRELAIRGALGATPSTITLTVMRQALAPFGSGIALGFAAAWLVVDRLAGQLFETPVHDPPAFLWPILVLVVIGVVASYWPSRTAVRAPVADLLRL
jgi:predicted permease